MTSIRRAKIFMSEEINLMISGEWSEECDAEIERGGFDKLELSSADYEDYTCLIPHAKRITALSIGVRSKSAVGLDSLCNLQSLSVGYSQGKDFDFSALPALRRLNISGWFPYYSATLFKSRTLESLRIEGYSGTDCNDHS